MGAGRRVLVALCGLVACLLMAPSAFAAFSGIEPGFEMPGKEPPYKGEPDPVPEACKFEPGELGSYIVVLQDWVADPEPVARDQAARYGGKVGHIYAFKAYSALYPPASATALQAEPTVDYIEINRLIWMDDSSGVIQWRSCPLAPPLGPTPPAPLPPNPDAEVEPVPPAPAAVIPPSGAPGTKKSQPTRKRCKKRSPGKMKKARSRCARKHAHQGARLSSLFGGVEQTRHQLN